MFSKRFVTELFKAQWIYKDASIRQIFDKLAHSSIMKLNETSMTKLYSLMVMGVKFQLLRCVEPGRMLEVTRAHMKELKAMCGSKVTDELMDACSGLCDSVYGNFSAGDWVACKQQLAQFFQGRKVRVSLFLQQDIQSQDGTLALDGAGPLPSGAEAPGTLRTYALGGGSARVQLLPHPMYAACLGGATDCGAAAATALGGNMYVRVAEAPTSRGGEAKAGAAMESRAAPMRPRESTTTAELSLLADLVGSGFGDDKDGNAESFRLELFQDDADGTIQVEGCVITALDGNAQRKTAQERLRDLDLDDKAESKDAKEEDDDDLLALMDSAK
ncbi:organic solute transport protein 1-domain-containing protein [Pelagophyceae sp. CCMP2097]|nr:organic solute transport protein 1-domain-containing protein [Pelagophyceae sp. CCMP2097]